MRRLPVMQPVSSLRSDGTRAVVYPADVHGRFNTARRIVFVVLMAIYAAIPWIHVNGRPAVFLDIEHRQFFLLGATFNAQDVWLLFFLITGVGFSLLVTTALAGRAWCGWACPQTVFLEGVYRRIERLVEGSREVRKRRDAGPWSFDKTWRKLVVHAAYLVVSAVLAHVFVSYFVSLPRLYQMVQAAPAQHWEAFVWTSAITLALYGNFAHFREQLCLGVCPYGRLQAALTDADAIVVGYDAERGEPRGKASQAGRGDCVDCGRCVVVCPTGIDIRNGAQLDCIGCTACIDACDEIMDKLGQKRGLVRYDSLRGFEEKVRRFWRPRLLVYVLFGVLGVLALSFALRSRTTFEANVLRLRGAPYTLQDGQIQNAFELHLINKHDETTTFLIEPQEPSGMIVVAPLRRVQLAPLASMDVPFFLRMSQSTYRGEVSVPVKVRVEGSGAEARTLLAPFLGPAVNQGAP